MCVFFNERNARSFNIYKHIDSRIEKDDEEHSGMGSSSKVLVSLGKIGNCRK